MGRNIIWYSTADGSWGGCDEDDLLIVDVESMSESDLDSLDAAQFEDEVYDILIGVLMRNKKE